MNVSRAYYIAQEAAASRAFTLIEMMVAILISAIILAALNTVFFGAIRLHNRASDAAAETLPTDHAIGVMKKDLFSIVPPGMLAGSMGSDAISTSLPEAPALEIFSNDGTLSDDAPWGDVQKIDYILRAPATRGSAGRDLVRAVTRNLLATGTVVPDQQILLSSVQNLKFSFYDGTNWNDTWSTTLSNIPVSIRVSIDFVSSKNDAQLKVPVQFTVPIVSWANTNSITNMVGN